MITTTAVSAAQPDDLVEGIGGLEVLEADLAELDNSVYHLIRSNVELAQVQIIQL